MAAGLTCALAGIRRSLALRNAGGCRVIGLLLPILMLVLGVGSPAVALAEGRAAAAAESLFLDGRRLMDAERYAEACQRFEDSQRLDPAAGTALNLARCYTLIQRSASAWSSYREAAALASVANQREREQAALAAAAELEPHLAKLLLKRDQAQPGVLIELDGNAVPESLFAVAAPVDSLAHEVLARRGSKVLWRISVEAVPGQTLEVQIPRFPPEPPPPSDPGSRPSQRTTGDSVPEGRAAFSRARSTASIALAATSALAIGYAVFEVIRARNAYDESRPGCNDSGKCDATSLAHREVAFDRARRADVALVLAGGAAVGAGVLWLTAGPARDTASRGARLAWSASWKGAW